MQNALASLHDPAAVGQSALAGFAAGQRFGEDQRLRKAMSAISINPDDPEANRTVMELDPQTGARLQEMQRQRQFGQATVDYFQAGRPQGNALAGLPGVPQPVAPVAQNALMPPAASGSTFGEAFAPLSAPAPAQPQVSQAMPGSDPRDLDGDGEIDFSPLGQATSAQDEAFIRMLRADPKRAFEIDSEMRDRATDRLKLQRDAFGYAASRLGGVSDEAGYRDAVADIQRRIDPLGASVSQFLPTKFPGVASMREIRLGAIDAEDQVRLFMQEANIEADNARADRNTDSMIETRETRAAEYARNNRERSANQRRGQDITDSRVRSGRKPKVVSVKTVAQAQALKPGTLYRGPDGQVRER
ncbi:hypothetical protein [Pelagerythrobacter sp.]|uniref:hypothetical protein n=1 Tax=Pelagerythrobacter sp. TaxID=2800702 RepID=UPI0035B17557